MALITVLFPVQSHYHYPLRVLPVAFIHTITRSFLGAFVQDLPHSAQDNFPLGFCSASASGRPSLSKATWPPGYPSLLPCALCLYFVPCLPCSPLAFLSGLFPHPKNGDETTYPTDPEGLSKILHDVSGKRDALQNFLFFKVQFKANQEIISCLLALLSGR